MRTDTIVTRLLWSIRKWLCVILIQRKRVLNSREAAIYLMTSLKDVYTLTGNHCLPFHITRQQLLFFKRKEIDAWLRKRRRKDLPVFLKKKKYQMWNSR